MNRINPDFLNTCIVLIHLLLMFPSLWSIVVWICFFPFLNIGVIFATFHSLGNAPESRLTLNKSVNGVAIASLISYL